MKFSDYEPKDLVGKKVLHESGMSYDSSRRKVLTTITSIIKTGFKIKDAEGVFDFKDGGKKGRGMGVVSNCKLITEDEAADIRIKWKQTRERLAIKNLIEQKIDSLDLDTLIKIKDIILDTLTTK